MWIGSSPDAKTWRLRRLRATTASAPSQRKRQPTHFHPFRSCLGVNSVRNHSLSLSEAIADPTSTVEMNFPQRRGLSTLIPPKVCYSALRLEEMLTDHVDCITDCKTPPLPLSASVFAVEISLQPVRFFVFPLARRLKQRRSLLPKHSTKTTSTGHRRRTRCAAYAGRGELLRKTTAWPGTRAESERPPPKISTAVLHQTALWHA